MNSDADQRIDAQAQADGTASRGRSTVLRNRQLRAVRGVVLRDRVRSVRGAISNLRHMRGCKRRETAERGTNTGLGLTTRSSNLALWPWQWVPRGREVAGRLSADEKICAQGDVVHEQLFTR
jgi:hypothetical protein